MSRSGVLLRRVLRWCVPDLAFATACITLFYCLFLFQGYRQLLRDSDAGWHIRNGESILATATLPRTDPYSFTRAGQPWFAWEWLSDVAVGELHNKLGLKGVAVFYAAAIAAGVWLWFRLHWELGGNFLIACAMAPLLLSTCNIHWLARPHVLSWLFLLLAIFPRRPNLLLVGAMTVLWANVHASFFMAPVIALIFLIRNRDREGAVAGPGKPLPDGRGSDAYYLKAFAITALAPLLNPYGVKLYVHVFRYLTDNELLSRIGEFQSFDFHTAGAEQIIAAVLLGIVGGTLALTQKRYDHFTLAMLISAMALRSARALPLSALLLLPIANAAITRWLGTRSFLSYGDNLRAQDARFHGLALAPLVVVAAFFLTPAAGFPADQFPVAAYAHIPPNARLFAPDKFGGYLIYRSNGSLKVFFDGRSDLYGADFLKKYQRLVQVRPGWREYWESFHFTHALVPADAPLLPALEQLGWRPEYHDKTATFAGIPRNVVTLYVLQQNIGRNLTEYVARCVPAFHTWCMPPIED